MVAVGLLTSNSELLFRVLHPVGKQVDIKKLQY
jgi:hypothetical protein